MKGIQSVPAGVVCGGPVVPEIYRGAIVVYIRVAAPVSVALDVMASNVVSEGVESKKQREGHEAHINHKADSGRPQLLLGKLVRSVLSQE